ncbi:hypothetical protein JL722_1421 [Aureococcus anophagefferens]|nr:hypothetical protein JL722_1421 [Aureococcus anophagefferens]
MEARGLPPSRPPPPVNDKWLSSEGFGPDALRRFGPERTTFGRDAVGEYTAATQLWTDVAGAPVLETTTREYGDSTWVLQQRWPAGCANGGARDGNEVLGAFPTFAAPPNAPTLNYASWGGNQLSDATVGRWLPGRAAAAASRLPYPPPQSYAAGCASLYQDRCPRTYPYYNSTWLGGPWQGAPTVWFDDSLRAVAAAPLTRHLESAMVATRRFDTTAPLIALGPAATLDALPTGYAHETLLVGARGVDAVLRKLGDALLAVGGKRRAPPAGPVLRQLGYWTDRGSFYYGNPRRPGDSMAETLLAVRDAWDAAGLPVRYLQLDDWWFQQHNGDFGGMVDWTGCTANCSPGGPAVFPEGLGAFADGLGAPVALYMGLVSNFTRHGPVRLDGRFAVPASRQFYDDLFRTMTKTLRRRPALFEQDFLSYWFGKGRGPPSFLSTPGAGEQWLRDLDAAALSAGVPVQLCMNTPATILASTRLQSATHARASMDNTRDPLTASWKVGLAASLLRAVGLAASVDNVFASAGGDGGCHGGFNCSQPNPYFEVALAALSGGPVGIGDAAEALNASAARAAASRDGNLLRPTRNLATLDAAFRLSFWDLRERNLWAAETRLGEYVWHYVLSVFLDEAEELDLVLDLGRDTRRAVAVDWPLTGGDRVYVTTHLDPSAPLVLEASPFDRENARFVRARLAVVAPVAPRSEFAVLGELDKVVVAGRVVRVVDDDDGVDVSVAADPGEVVALSVVHPWTYATLTTACAADAAGAATVACRVRGDCECVQRG